MTQLRRTTKRAVAVIALCLLVSVGIYSNDGYSVGFFGTVGSATQRLLSEEANDGTPEEQTPTEKGTLQHVRRKTSTSCEVREPMRRPVPPTLASSYPGSGDEVVDRLVQAITGLSTGHDYHDEQGEARSKQAVTIKTYFPSHTSFATFGPFSEIERTILLLRNPLYAFPSFHNYLYRVVNNIKDGSVKAPREVWKKWCDEFFDVELKNWQVHTHWWMEHYNLQHRLVVTYEELMNSDTGPKTIGEIGEFLSAYQIVSRTTVSNAEELECLWNAVVQQREGANPRDALIWEDNPLDYPFTVEQLEKMEFMLEELRVRWIGPLGELLGEYVAAIRDARVAMLLEETRTEVLLDEMRGLLRGESENPEQ